MTSHLDFYILGNCDLEIDVIYGMTLMVTRWFYIAVYRMLLYAKDWFSNCRKQICIWHGRRIYECQLKEKTHIRVGSFIQSLTEDYSLIGSFSVVLGNCSREVREEAILYRIFGCGTHAVKHTSL